MNRWFIALIIFPLIMAIHPLKEPHTITIILRREKFVLVVVASHVGFWQIFGIWNNRILDDPLWKLIYWLIGWVSTRSSLLWPAVFLEMTLLATLVTSQILSSSRTSSRTTTISIAVDPEINLLQRLVDQTINGRSVCFQKWRLILRLLLASSQLPPIWIDKIAVFTHSLLHKVLISDELLWWYEIRVKHTKFLDKFRNILVLLNLPNMESGIRSTLKDAIDVP